MNSQLGFLLILFAIGLVVMVTTQRGRDSMDVILGRKKAV